MTGLRVLRVYHSGVVTAWRARDRELARSGVATTLVTAQRWNEGSRVVELHIADGEDVAGLRTFGHHPYRFLYDPVRLWRVLRSRHFDVIDVHEEPASLAAAEVQLLAWVAGTRVPFALYSAQNIPKRYPVPFRWFERVALRRARAVHTCNEAVGEILREKGFRGIVCNLGLGVDVEQFRPAAHREPSGDAVRVGYVGRLEPHKGVDVLLHALQRVPGCSLRVVGDGPERAHLEDLAQELLVEGRTAFPGSAPQDALPAIYAELDVVAIPSLETPDWIEQFGRVAVEAMAAGVPVVASDSGSLREVVGDAGVLVPPGDAGALAEALARLETDRSERARLGKLGVERAQRWSWAAIARRQADLYREMADRAA